MSQQVMHLVSISGGQVEITHPPEERGTCQAQGYILGAAGVKREGVYDVLYGTADNGSWYGMWRWARGLPDFAALEIAQDSADEKEHQGNDQEPLERGEEQADSAEHQGQDE